MAKIRWTDKAVTNLESIFDYIAHDSKVYAARFVKSLILATKKLENMPQIGRSVPELPDHKVREVIYRDYRIVYRTESKTNYIEILAVVHGFRDLPSHFSKEDEL